MARTWAKSDVAERSHVGENFTFFKILATGLLQTACMRSTSSLLVSCCSGAQTVDCVQPWTDGVDKSWPQEKIEATGRG